MRGNPHVRICGGGGEQSLLLPGKQTFAPRANFGSVACLKVCTALTFLAFEQGGSKAA